MTVDAYLNPDFTLQQKLIFLAAAFAGVLLCDALIIVASRASAGSYHGGKKAKNRVQRFYEMMISATSVMSFACAYVIINHIYSSLQGMEGSAEYASFGPLISAWEGGRDFVLLLLICLSCVLNTLLDRLVIPLKKIDKEEKASIRMLGMFYAIIILAYLNVIGDESEYSPVMMYYLGLMVGRFVYFDASFMDFIHAIRNAFRNSLLLITGLALTGGLCYFGFSAGYLLERNYYIVGVFYTHLFVLAAIFILHHSHVLELVFPERNDPEEDDEEYGDEDYRDEDYRDGDYRDGDYRDEDFGDEYDDYDE